MPGGAPVKLKEQITKYADVVKDRPDLRDLFYLPTLRPLGRSCDVPPMLRRQLLPVRNQLVVDPEEDQGTCTAQALANVVDLLRYDNLAEDLAKVSKAYECVSAGMLYEHGKDIEYAESGTNTEGLRSLRTAIKGFYHNGVCTDALWRDKGDTPEDKQRKLIERYASARQTPLGSYYRLQPILNDYHAALNEVGVIYAAAEIHDGWAHESVGANTGPGVGAIKLPGDRPAGLISGNHAFAIVGYTPEGFLVLNSWGGDWGNYNPKIERKEPGTGDGSVVENPLPGVALWSYQDWAERLIDGWVLRLGVSAPEAFRFSFGRQGLQDFLAGEIKVGSIPRHELIGHYVHIDDGQFVSRGPIPSDMESIKATCTRLEDRRMPQGENASLDKKYDGILLWLAGGSGGSKDVLNHIAKTKDFWKQKKIYPITVLWCSDLMDQAGSFLERIEQGAFELVRAPGIDLDRRIEIDARSIGRAVWRDIASSASKAASCDTSNDGNLDTGPGALREAYDELAKVKETKIHIVGEGVGAILLHRLLKELDPTDIPRLASVSLIMPGCSVTEFQEMRRWLEKWHLGPNVILAGESTAKRFRFGRYRGSLLDLAQMSFVEKPRRRSAQSIKTDSAQRQRPLGTDPRSRLIGTFSKKKFEERFLADDVLHNVRVEEINLSGGSERIASLRDVSAGRDALNAIEKLILGDKATGGAPNVPTAAEPKREDQVRTSARPALPTALIGAPKN
jgi:hypothetical protein